MELADVVDSKSTAGDSVPVRVRPPAPLDRVWAQFAFQALSFFPFLMQGASVLSTPLLKSEDIFHLQSLRITVEEETILTGVFLQIANDVCMIPEKLL